MFDAETANQILSAQTQVCSLEDSNLEAVILGLKQYGAVRILPPCKVEDFEESMLALMVPIVHQSTKTDERDRIRTDGTTSTVNKGLDAIPFHREASYAPNAPDILALYCVRPAKDYGQTELCDGAVLLDSLSAEIRRFVCNITLKWSWTAPPDRWQAALGVNTVEEATGLIAALSKLLPEGESFEGAFEGDVLEGEYSTPCVTTSLISGRKAFSNSLLIHRYRKGFALFRRDLFRPTLEDGSQFPDDVLAEIYKTAQEIKYTTDWQPQEMLIFDNVRVMHGRQAFDDRDRQIYIKMGHIRKELIATSDA